MFDSGLLLVLLFSHALTAHLVTWICGPYFSLMRFAAAVFAPGNHWSCISCFVMRLVLKIAGLSRLSAASLEWLNTDFCGLPLFPLSGFMSAYSIVGGAGFEPAWSGPV